MFMEHTGCLDGIEAAFLGAMPALRSAQGEAYYLLITYLLLTSYYLQGLPISAVWTLMKVVRNANRVNLFGFRTVRPSYTNYQQLELQRYPP